MEQVCIYCGEPIEMRIDTWAHVKDKTAWCYAGGSVNKYYAAEPSPPAPTAPVGQPEKCVSGNGDFSCNLPKGHGLPHMAANGKDGVGWYEPAAPAANALPEMQTPSPFDKLSREELIDRMLTSEHRGWQLAHNKRRCGHPRAFWQDANWPASEDNYDPETHSSDPAMEYRCLICQAERQLAAAQQEIAELKGYQLNYEHATKLERQSHAGELKQARRNALGACLAAVSELDATERAQGVIVSLMEKP